MSKVLISSPENVEAEAENDDCFVCFLVVKRALEEMDSLFLRASRKDPNATVKLMKSQLGTAMTALDR